MNRRWIIAGETKILSLNEGVNIGSTPFGDISGNLTADSTDLNITTTTSGDININSVDGVDIDAGGTSAIEITAGGGVDIDAGSTGTIDITTANGNIDIDAGGTGDISLDTNDGEISINAGDELDLDAGDFIDIDAGDFIDMDAITWIDIDAGTTIGITAAKGNMDIVTTDGDLNLTSSANGDINLNSNVGIDIDAGSTGAVEIDAAASHITLDAGGSGEIRLNSGSTAIQINLEKDTSADQLGMFFGDGIGGKAGLRMNKGTAEYLNAGATWAAMGSGGGGSSVFSLYETFDADDDDYTDWDATNLSNATFGEETSAPLSGSKSYKLTNHASAATEYLLSPNVTVPLRSKGKSNSIKFPYIYPGSDDDISASIYDLGTLTELNSVSLTAAETSTTTAEIFAHIRSDATDIALKLTIDAGNTSIEMVFDDVEFSDDPFVSKNMLVEQTERWQGSSGYGGTDDKIRRMGTQQRATGSGLFLWVDNAVNGTKIEILRDGYYAFHYNDIFGAAGGMVGFSKNSTELTTIIGSIAESDKLIFGVCTNANQDTTASWSGQLVAGDIIRPHTSGAAGSADDSRSTLTAYGRAENERIIAAVDSNLTNWTTYTPTGTWVSGNETYTGKWRRVGQNMEVEFNIALSGAPTSADLTIDIPSDYTIDTSVLLNVGTYSKIEGNCNISDTGTTVFTGTFEYGDTNSVKVMCNLASATYVKSSTAVTQAAPMTFANTDFIHGWFSVPIVGWGSEATALVGIPTDPSIIEYETTTAQSIDNNSDEIIDYDTKSTSNGGAITVTTGAAWKATANVSGWYGVGGSFGLASDAGWESTERAKLSLYVDGVLKRVLQTVSPHTATLTLSCAGYAEVYLAKNSYVDLRAFQDSDGAIALDTSATTNYITVRKLGINNA